MADRATVTVAAMDPEALTRLTFRYHLASAAANGVTWGIYVLHDFVARKTLDAPAWQLTVIVALWPLANLFAVYWGEAMQGRSKTPYLIAAGVFGRLVLLGAFLITSSESFIPFLLLVSAAASVIEPAQNAIFQSNYPTASRGQRYGWGVSVMFGTAAAVSYGGGLVLDLDPWLFQHLFAIAGLAGFLQCFLLSRIPAVPGERTETGARSKGLDRLDRPYLDMIRLLRNRPDFFRFEAAFFVYGCAFIALLPVVPIYFADYLKTDYSDYALARGSVGHLGIVLLAPVFGRVMDRLEPYGLCRRVFALLAVFPALLFASIYLPGNGLLWAVLAFGVYGVAMSGVMIAWGLGSIHFAGREDSSRYQSVHVTLVGLRGLLAPWLGYAALSLGGPAAVFALCVGLLLLSSRMMARGARSASRDGEG